MDPETHERLRTTPLTPQEAEKLGSVRDGLRQILDDFPVDERAGSVFYVGMSRVLERMDEDLREGMLELDRFTRELALRYDIDVGGRPSRLRRPRRLRRRR